MSTSPPSAAIVIRPALATDAETLGRLGTLLLALHHQFDSSRFIPARADTSRLYADFLDSQRQRADAILLVAEEAGVAIGYAYAEIDGMDFMALRGPAGVLHDLIVDPESRSRGVGRMLVAGVRDELVARGMPQLVLSAAARNAGAQALFASLGFRPTMIEMTLDL